LNKQGVALMGCNTTGPPWSVDQASGRAGPRGRPVRRQSYRRRQTPVSRTILAY